MTLTTRTLNFDFIFEYTQRLFIISIFPYKSIWTKAVYIWSLINFIPFFHVWWLFRYNCLFTQLVCYFLSHFVSTAEYTWLKNKLSVLQLVHLFIIWNFCFLIYLNWSNKVASNLFEHLHTLNEKNSFKKSNLEYYGYNKKGYSITKNSVRLNLLW